MANLNPDINPAFINSSGLVDPDSIYPTPASRTSNWWIFRTTITQGNTVLLAYTPLSVSIHYDKAKAIEYMKKKVAIVNPTEVKIVLGPVSREEAFNWTTLNPFVYENPATESSAAAKNGKQSTPPTAKTKDDPDPYADDPNAG